MFVAVIRLQIDPGAVWLLETQLRTGLGLEKAPGFTEFSLLKRIWDPQIPEIDDEVELLLITSWETWDSFIGWTNSADGRAAYSKFNMQHQRWAAPAETTGYEVRARRQALAVRSDESAP